VTVSIGVAEHQEGEEINQLFNRVDKALYAAKKEGRNQVKLYLVEKY
jgi:diguanylate cyclase (GGDEF)-like protein